MGFDSASLPPHVLRLMSEKERRKLGKAGQTPEETATKAEAKSERELQGMMVNYLRLKGIEVLWHRTDKKSHATIGWPDLTFAITGFDGWQTRVYAVAVEVKLPGKYLNLVQRQMRKKMTSPGNAWTCRTLTSLDELKMFLEAIAI